MLISIFVHRCSQWTHLNGCPLLSFCVFKLKKILLMCQAHDILTENWINLKNWMVAAKLAIYEEFNLATLNPKINGSVTRHCILIFKNIYSKLT